MFVPPTIRAGAEPSEFDRFLGLADLVEAFELGATRTEVSWVGDSASGWKERERVCKKRPRNCDWAFAMIEMLLDPVLSAWIPKWIVEQYERRNPAFRGIVERELKNDKEHDLSNRKLILKVRRALRSDAKRRKDESTRLGAAAKADDEDRQPDSDSGDSSGAGGGGSCLLYTSPSPRD